MAYGYTFLNRRSMKKIKVVYFPEHLSIEDILYGVDHEIEEIHTKHNIKKEDIFYYVNITLKH